MSTYQHQVDDVVRHAKAQGWTERETHGDSRQLFAPSGRGIVTTPRDTHDTRAFRNFLADLKRLGYKPYDASEELLEKRAAKTARQKILDYVIANPDAVITPTDAVALTGVSANTVQVALGKLWNAGWLIKLQHGQYKLDARNPDALARSGNGADRKPASEPATTTPEPEAVVPPPVAEPHRPAPSDVAGDDAAELLAIQEAMDLILTGLARLEPIVKKYQRLQRKFRAAKEALRDDD